MVKMYLLTMFYPSVAKAQSILRKVNLDMKYLAGNNWRLVSPGEHICAIAFRTETAPAVIRDRLSLSGHEDFCYLLVEVASTQCGFLTQGVWEWFEDRPPRDSRR